MKCHLCSNLIVVETDPEHTEYVYKSGAYKILHTDNATDVTFFRDDEEVINLILKYFMKKKKYIFFIVNKFK